MSPFLGSMLQVRGLSLGQRRTSLSKLAHLPHPATKKYFLCLIIIHLFNPTLHLQTSLGVVNQTDQSTNPRIPRASVWNPWLRLALSPWIRWLLVIYKPWSYLVSLGRGVNYQDILMIFGILGVSINAGSPIAGWFISWFKSIFCYKWMITGGTPMTWESPIMSTPD